MRIRAMIALAALGLALTPVPALAYHAIGCPPGTYVNFDGGNPSAHNWMNVCAGVINVYFFGTFANVTGGDPSGMCGYLVADGAAADAYVGLTGNYQGGPNPTVVYGFGDYPADHPGTNCGVPQ